jgi:hypothetical protein
MVAAAMIEMAVLVQPLMVLVVLDAVVIDVSAAIHLISASIGCWLYSRSNLSDLMISQIHVMLPLIKLELMLLERVGSFYFTHLSFVVITDSSQPIDLLS